MTGAAAIPFAAFGVAGCLRIGARLLMMLILLIICVPMHYLWRLARLPNPWPRMFLAGVGSAAGMKIRVEGQRQRRGAFLLANHVSWLDIPAIARANGSAFVAQDGLAAVPVLRWLCALNDTVFIARHDRASVAEQVVKVREALRDTGALTIFPETTTSDGSGLLPFKSSLLSAIDPVPEGIAVVPVVLAYGPESAEIAWIGVEPGRDNFLRILARSRPIHLTVRFLAPLSGAALANRKTMSAAARSAILDALQQLD
jgi:1-acyl-sn-glycerol-3-phosphate acyltransferase